MCSARSYLARGCGRASRAFWRLLWLRQVVRSPSRSRPPLAVLARAPDLVAVASSSGGADLVAASGAAVLISWRCPCCGLLAGAALLAAGAAVGRSRCPASAAVVLRFRFPRCGGGARQILPPLPSSPAVLCCYYIGRWLWVLTSWRVIAAPACCDLY